MPLYIHRGREQTTVGCTVIFMPASTNLLFGFLCKFFLNELRPICGFNRKYLLQYSSNTEDELIQQLHTEGTKTSKIDSKH